MAEVTAPSDGSRSTSDVLAPCNSIPPPRHMAVLASKSQAHKHVFCVCVHMDTVCLLTISVHIYLVCAESCGCQRLFREGREAGCSGTSPLSDCSCVHQRLRRLLQAGLLQDAFDKGLEYTQYSCHSNHVCFRTALQPSSGNSALLAYWCFWPQDELFLRGLKADGDATAYTFLNRCIVAIECYFLLFWRMRVLVLKQDPYPTHHKACSPAYHRVWASR